MNFVNFYISVNFYLCVLNKIKVETSKQINKQINKQTYKKKHCKGHFINASREVVDGRKKIKKPSKKS